MRLVVTLLVACTMMVAGCLDGESVADDGVDVPDEGTQETPPLPDDISESGTVAAGGDPFNFADMPPCSQDVSSCDFYPFTVPDGIQVVVDPLLTWVNPANDFDLYLFTADGQEVSREGINFVGEPPDSEHDMPPVQLGPGDYEFYVVAWAVAGGMYELEATFAYA